MSQIQFLTLEQEALIPEYQEKWRQIYLSTQPIDRDRAEAAVKNAYSVMRKKEPEVIFRSSPRAALEQLQLHTSQAETSQSNTKNSQKKLSLLFYMRGIWETIRLINKQQNAGPKPIYDLLNKISDRPSKLLAKHVNRCLPDNLTTQDIVEQSFLDSLPFFDNLGKQMSTLGESDFSTDLNNRKPEDWQESFQGTAANIETQLGWLPAKRFLFRGWLKQMSKNTLMGKITGVKHPKFRDIISFSLSPLEQRFLVENRTVVISELAISCIWLDFSYSVLNYLQISPKWDALQNIVQQCGWIFDADNLCSVCDRPTKILLDDDNQLHGEGESALEFPDGFAAYAYHGMALPETYGMVHPGQWQAQWILEADRESFLPQILAREIGAIRLCQELSIPEIDSMQEYTLLKLESVGVRGTHILKRIDPQTEHINAAFIPWHTSSVWSAIEYANQNCSAEDFPIPGG